MPHMYYKRSTHIWYPVSELSPSNPATFTSFTQTQPSNHANGLISRPYKHILSEDNCFYTVSFISEGQKWEWIPSKHFYEQIKQRSNMKLISARFTFWLWRKIEYASWGFGATVILIWGKPLTFQRIEMNTASADGFSCMPQHSVGICTFNHRQSSRNCTPVHCLLFWI
jgi:hypothetical protein